MKTPWGVALAAGVLLGDAVPPAGVPPGPGGRNTRIAPGATAPMHLTPK